MITYSGTSTSEFFDSQNVDDVGNFPVVFNLIVELVDTKLINLDSLVINGLPYYQFHS